MTKKTIKAYALKNAIEHNGKATAGPIINSLFKEGLKKKDIKKIISEINNVLKEVNSLSIDQQNKYYSEIQKLIKHRKVRQGLPSLSKAKKGKVTG